MTKRDKVTLVGLLILFGCVLYSGGLSAGWNMIKTCAGAVAEFMKTMLSLAIQLPGELGITDWLWTKGIYGAIAVAAALLAGYAFTRKEKRKLLGIISSVVILISTLLTFSKSK